MVTPPRLWQAQIKALLHRPAATAHPQLPDCRIQSTPVTLAPNALAHYHQLIGWQGAEVHPCYLQVEAFALTLDLLAHTDMPFAPMGLVHVANNIQVMAPVVAAAPLHFSLWLDGLTPHRRGHCFGLFAEAWQHGRCIWRQRSEILARNCAPEAAKSPTRAEAGSTATSIRRQKMAELAFSLADTRRYAWLSGDLNPIHLSNLTARLFGFRRAIAHGMFAKARIVSALADVLPQASELYATFSKPIALPAQGQLRCQPQGNKMTTFQFADAGTNALYLHGHWRALS